MTASDKYGQKRQETLDKLTEIHRLLCENMDAQQARTPDRYTHAGSLGHVNEELDNLIRFMGGQS